MTLGRGAAWRLYPDCMGERKKAYKKCEKCRHILQCSFQTLLFMLNNEGYEVDSSQYGELVYIDKKKDGA